jgi:hypothetical protein
MVTLIKKKKESREEMKQQPANKTTQNNESQENQSNKIQHANDSATPSPTRLSANRYLNNYHLKSGKTRYTNTYTNTNNSSTKPPQYSSSSNLRLEEIVELEEPPPPPSNKQSPTKLAIETNKKVKKDLTVKMVENKNANKSLKTTNVKDSKTTKTPPKQQKKPINIDHIDPSRLSSADFVKMSNEEKMAVLEKLEAMSKLSNSSRQSDVTHLNRDFDNEENSYDNNNKLITHRETLEEEIERKIEVLKQLEDEENEAAAAAAAASFEVNEHKRIILYLTKEIELQAKRVSESTRKFLEKMNEGDGGGGGGGMSFRMNKNHMRQYDTSATNSSSVKEVSEYESDSDFGDDDDATATRPTNLTTGNYEYKKVIQKRRFWWEKNPSNLRVPMYQMPNRQKLAQIKSKIDSGFIEEEILVPLDYFVKKGLEKILYSLSKF